MKFAVFSDEVTGDGGGGSVRAREAVSGVGRPFRGRLGRATSLPPGEGGG